MEAAGQKVVRIGREALGPCGNGSRKHVRTRKPSRCLRTWGNASGCFAPRVQLSQEKAAEAAGLSPQHLVDIEHGRTNPTVTSLVGIARALDVKIRDIFDRT